METNKYNDNEHCVNCGNKYMFNTAIYNGSKISDLVYCLGQFNS